MTLPTLNELILYNRDAEATFVRYQDQELWYQVDYPGGTFTFPVPIDDTAGGVFLRADKVIFFMRWMRRHLAMLTSAASVASAEEVA